MYSEKLSKILKSKKIEIGDSVLVKKTGSEYTGILMPRATESNILVIKLENGYNVGIDSSGAEISLVQKGENLFSGGAEHKTQSSKHETRDPKRETPHHRGEVAILGCGGTISSKVEYKTGAVYPVTTPEELVAMFPQLSDISSFHVRKLFSIFSEDMSHEHWKMIAKEVASEINAGAQGVVLMHGTDTLHYTSAVLSFMLQNLPVPVILVGAQRSSDRPSSDNELNLLNSIYVARHSDISEVAVCMHSSMDDNVCHVHKGTRVRKMHTSRRDAFKSINSVPLAAVDYRKKLFEKFSEYKKRDPDRKLVLDTKLNDNVAMVYVHPGIKSKFIDSLSSYDGVVLLATGLGHVPTNPFNDKHAHSIFKNLQELIESGVSVVAAPETIYGRLDLNVYSTGRMLDEIGVIGNGADWTPECAYTKLCWVLGHEKKPVKVKELMMKNICGEISLRSPLV
ncbi:TPA: Glu-tRNA(Gln) amidotransferase subunit GatD [Candidatus Micrarchaeota archaeon]|nr:Glu-tRNA(Gln) amidotransferase subunit GatD [Candidatus Micrarchaeota archaeon]